MVILTQDAVIVSRHLYSVRVQTFIISSPWRSFLLHLTYHSLHMNVEQTHHGDHGVLDCITLEIMQFLNIHENFYKN